MPDVTFEALLSDELGTTDAAEGSAVAFQPLLNDARAATIPKTPTHIYIIID